jgi:hypothetical protein
MGRSVPPWRTRVEAELERLVPYRRALPISEHAIFDALLNDVRQRRAAGGMLPAIDTWHMMLLNMLVGLAVRNEQLSQRLQALEEGRCDD